MMTIPVGKAAYAAGIVDGEGCLALEVRRGKQRWVCFNFRLTVVNTDRRIVEFMQSLFRGLVRRRTASSSARRAAAYGWRLNGRAALPALDAMLPHMVGKKRQAAIAVGYLRAMAGLPKPVAGVPHPPAVVAFQLATVREMKADKQAHKVYG